MVARPASYSPQVGDVVRVNRRAPLMVGSVGVVRGPYGGTRLWVVYFGGAVAETAQLFASELEKLGPEEEAAYRLGGR